MDLDQIKTELQKQDFYYRLQAIVALKDYPAEVAVPLLKDRVQDPEFVVRSFVARQLGTYHTPDSSEMLRQLLKDNNPNVRAEAANSISLFGDSTAPDLVKIFLKDKHWLVRISVLAALVDMACHAEVLEVCIEGVADTDESVQENSVDALISLISSPHRAAALSQLLVLKDSELPHIRIRVARALKHFDEPEAKAAMLQLRQDPDHRVVGAAMEDLLP
jgi:HEAT repeat protein